MSNFIWIANNSLIREDTSKINLELNNTKSQHLLIAWKSWTWKSILIWAIIFSLIKASIIEQIQRNNKKENNSFILLDPTWSDNILIKGLLKDLLDLHPEYSRVVNVIEYSKNWKGKVYDWYFFNKEIVINPLFNKKLIDNISFLDITVNFVINWLKWMIWDTSSFWWRNTPALRLLIKSFLLFNVENYKNWIDIIYSLQDINTFLNILIQDKKLTPDIIKNFDNLINSKNSEISKLGNELFQQIKRMPTNLSKDQNFYETTVSKLEIFIWDFWKTFWYQKKINELIFDYYDFIINKKIDTEVLLFDLELFSIEERKVFHWFLNSSSEVFWNIRNYKNPNLGSTYIFLEEFQSFLEIKNNTKDYSILSLEQILNQRRKHKINYTFIMQFVTKEMKDLLNNIWVSFIFALPPEQASLFKDNLTNWTDWNTFITEKDIWNLNRWEYFALFDSINNWLCTVSGKSFDLWNTNDRKILLS